MKAPTSLWHEDGEEGHWKVWPCGAWGTVSCSSKGLLVFLTSYCCSVAQSCPLFVTHKLKHTRLPCPSLSPGVCSNSCPLSRWCHQPSYPLSPPSPHALNLSRHQGLFQQVGSSNQVVKVLSFSISPSMNIQGWFPLKLTDLTSLLSKYYLG